MKQILFHYFKEINYNNLFFRKIQKSRLSWKGNPAPKKLK